MSSDEENLSLGEQWIAAADAGDVEAIAELLCQHPDLINSCYNFQRIMKKSSALHVCTWRNHSQLAEFLLDHGADTELRDEAGLTPLQLDVLRVCTEKMRPIPLLRTRCIDVSSPVAYAAFKRKLVKDRSQYDQIDTSTLELLLRHGACVNSPCEIGKNSLFIAVEDGLIKHVRLLLDYGGEALVCDRNGRSLLEVAAEHGYTDIIELLVERHPELIQIGGENALRAAIRHDFISSLERLFDAVEAQVSIESDIVELNGSLLCLAVEYNAPQTTAFLVRCPNAQLNWMSSRGESATLIACRQGHTSLLSLLLEYGAQGNCRNKGGCTPYHVALQHYAFDAIPVLASYDVNINLLSGASESPLVFAVRKNYSNEVLKTLIANGATFVVPSLAIQDDLALRLTSYIQECCPSEIPWIVVKVLELGCVDDEILLGEPSDAVKQLRP